MNLSNDVFERRTSTGSGPFLFLDDCFAQIFSQIVTIIVKKLSNTNFISSRHIKREKSSLPVDVRGSKTPLLKLTIIHPVEPPPPPPPLFPHPVHLQNATGIWERLCFPSAGKRGRLQKLSKVAVGRRPFC